MVRGFNCLPCINAVDHCLSVISNWNPILWAKGLNIIRQLRWSGIVLSCLATCLVMIAICTEYWVKEFVRGIFVFRGLWKDCQLGKCTALVKMPSYIVFSIFFMLISAVTCYGSVIFGTLCLTGLPPPKKIKWTTLTISLCFMSGFTGGIGLFNFMRLSIEKAGTFLSWSLATGWFSVIVVCFAGVCHFVAKNWEEEAWAQALLGTTMVLTLQEDCMARTDSEDAQKKRRWAESDTSG